MKRTLAIAALICMGATEVAANSPGDDDGGDWRPALGTKITPSDRLFRTTGQPEPVWSAQVEYRDVVDRPDLVATFKNGGEVSRPGFATLKRSFGSGEFRPFVGMGVGVAATHFDDVSRDSADLYAVKAVVGGDLRFSDKVGGFVQYGYAIAGEDAITRRERKSHGLRFGLSIALN